MNKSVVIVDDMLIHRALVQSICKEFTISCFVPELTIMDITRTISQALNTTDVMFICDLNLDMPAVKGRDLILTASRVYPSLPIIIFSGDKEDAEEVCEVLKYAGKNNVYTVIKQYGVEHVLRARINAFLSQ